jgi:hypothetical protein
VVDDEEDDDSLLKGVAGTIGGTSAGRGALDPGFCDFVESSDPESDR